MRDSLNYCNFSEVEHLQREEPRLKIKVNIYLSRGRWFVVRENLPRSVAQLRLYFKLSQCGWTESE